MKNIKLIIILIMMTSWASSFACSIIYYIDTATGNIYVLNNEDYFYDVNAYIQIEPAKKDKLARAWYGWDYFAQGGVNEAGLFFDGTAIPGQGGKYKRPEKFNNLGDYILSKFKTVDEAVVFLTENNIQLDGAQMMFGDATGNAVVVSWENGVISTTYIKENSLVATNFNLANPELGNFPCYRFDDISSRIEALNKKEEITFREAGSLLAGAVQIPRKNEKGRTGGTLYSTFIDITNMELIVVYKLANSETTKIDLKAVFGNNKRKRIRLK